MRTAAGRTLHLSDGRRVLLRPIRESDAAEIVQAWGRLSRQSRYLRFMQHKKSLDLSVLERGVRPAAGECALVATIPADDGIDIVGAARFVPASPPDAGTAEASAATDRICEFAITVAEDWRGCGLSTALLSSLVRRARRAGYGAICGDVLADNGPMLALARRLKFEVLPQPDDATLVRVRRVLQPAQRTK